MRAFEPEEVKTLGGTIRVNREQWRALILMGLNTGCGAGDLAALPFSRIDLELGFHNFPRTKNAARRRCPLWPETLEAIEAYLPKRPKPAAKEFKELVFLTSIGTPWTQRGTATRARVDQMGDHFAKILKRLKLAIPGRNFYELRRTFRTMAAGCDRGAIDFIMGHATRRDGGEEDIGEVIYSQDYDYDDDVLSAVTDQSRERILKNGQGP